MFRVIEKLENKKKIKQTTQKKGVYYITQVVKKLSKSNLILIQR